MKQNNMQWEQIVRNVRLKVQIHFKEIVQSLDLGAYLEPENYFVSYIFSTTENMNEAEKSGLLSEINTYHKECLRNSGYPQTAIKDCTFASQEECEKKYNGNWYYYYK